MAISRSSPTATAAAGGTLANAQKPADTGHATQDHAPDLDRLGDVLDPLPTHRRKGEFEPLAQLLAHLARDAAPARLGQAFKAGGDVDAVAVDILALHDHVALVHADPKADALRLRHVPLATGHPFLDSDRAGDCVHDTGELDQGAIAHQLDDPAAVLGNQRVDEFPPMRLQALERAGLVAFHERRVADHVRGQDGGEAAFRARSHHGWGPPMSLTCSLPAIDRSSEASTGLVASHQSSMPALWAPLRIPGYVGLPPYLTCTYPAGLRSRPWKEDESRYGRKAAARFQVEADGVTNNTAGSLNCWRRPVTVCPKNNCSASGRWWHDELFDIRATSPAAVASRAGLGREPRRRIRGSCPALPTSPRRQRCRPSGRPRSRPAPPCRSGGRAGRRR